MAATNVLEARRVKAIQDQVVLLQEINAKLDLLLVANKIEYKPAETAPAAPSLAAELMEEIQVRQSLAEKVEATEERKAEKRSKQQ